MLGCMNLFERDIIRSTANQRKFVSGLAKIESNLCFMMIYIDQGGIKPEQIINSAVFNNFNTSSLKEYWMQE